MVQSYAQKDAVRYRYYVARAVGPDGKRLRLSTAPMEAVLIEALRTSRRSASRRPMMRL